MAPNTTMLKSGALLAMSALLVLSMLAVEAQASGFFCPLGCSVVKCGSQRCEQIGFMECECNNKPVRRGYPWG